LRRTEQRGIRTAGTAIHDHLTAAIQAYRQALEVYTRTDLPQDWAMTQNNLGIALVHQGVRTAGERGTQLLWKDMRTTQQHLQDILLNPNGLDTAALQTAQQQLTAQQGDLLQARLTLAQTVHGVLTPAQLTQATHIVQQLRENRTERHQLLTPHTQQR